ncbi:MAG TPA: PD-(D/E)XK nuclease family protein, partial [Acidimicrobiia bacterium]|nr:PD-(D/E)XK nuclease family protein [Acidimicrobiia bacterium]
RAVPVQLTDGRSVRFNGAIDRVDRAATGNLVVFDYKTGSTSSYTGIGDDDPVTAGTHLQLPIYARVARELFAEPGTGAEAYYWFVGKGNDRWIGYEVSPDIDAVFDTALQLIVDGIEAGCFVARPAPPGPRPWVDCHFCDPDGLGTADRWREWERKADDPALVGYFALAGLVPGEAGA